MSVYKGILMTDLTFFLQKGEKVIKDCDYLQFSGVGYSTFGGFVGGGRGVFGGLAGGHTVKTEGSVFDAKSCHMYLTNQRLVFCQADLDVTRFKERKIGNIISEIPLMAIEGVQPGTKLMLHSSIEIATRNSQGGIDKNVITFLEKGFKFLDLSAKRAPERDGWIQTIKQARENAVKKKK